MSAMNQLLGAMTVPEFLAWNPGDDRWELIDGTRAPWRPLHRDMGRSRTRSAD
jgi:hypothetical protein